LISALHGQITKREPGITFKKVSYRAEIGKKKKMKGIVVSD